VYSCFWETHRKATEHHLPYVINVTVQCGLFELRRTMNRWDAQIP